MRVIILLITIITVTLPVKCLTAQNQRSEKLRVIMMSDFPPIGVVKKGDDVPNTMKSDPDDMQSMVRFLLYANEFDIEGLVASAGTFAMTANKNNILGVLDRYGKVVGNLKTYDPNYPGADDLRAVTYEGRGNNNGVDIKFGCGKQAYTEIIGKGLDSEASNAIIAAADKPDPRPLWIGVWGGPREVAQAIWDVKNTRSEAELKAFISKLRIFLIYCQDATHEWMMNEFPDLFIIESRKTYQGMFGGHDPISDLAWVNEHIRFNHGPLCDIYPHEGMGCTGVCEGDSPAFLYLVSANRGISDPEDPTQPSWGGQYVRKENTNHYIDGPGITSISKWREDYQKEFKERADRCIKPKSEVNYTKPRIINTTDLGADPDDEQSMVRQLVCANEFDIEGLIVATGCWKKSQSNTDMLDKILDAYAEVYDNLTVHAEGFPTPEYLKSISVLGQKGYGMSDVGTGKDSPGSDLIIASVDKDDPRPVWVTGWGGMNTIAQAIWKVRETRSPEELKKFLSKLRLFDILGQDDAGAWIAKNFPNVFYIRATKVYNWQPPKNGEYQRNDIQSHGPLGAVYPDTKWATEGDTPAFMHVYPNGLNDPDKIDQGSWGGRFSFVKQEGIRSMSEVPKIQKDGETRFDPYLMYGNTPDGGTSIKMWEKGYNNDFAARMDWSITSKYEDANHHPIAVLNGDMTRNVLYINATAGSTIELSAAGSIDPDGDSLTYTWSFYEDPSSYNGTVSIQNNSSQTAIVVIPEDAAGKNIHIILEIHDNGTPNLYAYRRVILTTQTAAKTDLPFRQWLFEYIPKNYPNAKMTDHGGWLQAHVTEDMVANWTQWNEQDVTLKYLEAHALTNGKAIFIEKAAKTNWADLPAVTYFENAGYYIKGYDSKTMGTWEVENCNVIQFDGDGSVFTEKMAKDWANAQPKTAKVLRNEDPVSGMPYKPFPDKVLVTRVRHFDNICWKIATAGGTWYFENGETDGMTGFSSAFDQAGNDWIGNDADRGYNKSSSKGGRHEYRGWPNFGEGNFNHPQRKSNSISYWIDAAGNEINFDEKLEGDHLIMRTSNQTYELEYHFFPSHAAIKILKADNKYAFLFEGPVGGEQETLVAKDYYVLKDGIHREIKAGGLGFLDPEFGNKFPSSFFYLVDSDPKDTQVLYVGVKDVGPETAGDEGWRQGENMVIFSYGRDDDKRAYTGTDAVCVFGFHDKANHKKISKFIEARLKNPFKPLK